MSATTIRAADAAATAMARVGLIDLRPNGCAGLARGLDDLGFTPVAAQVDSGAPGPVQLLVMAVDAYAPEVCAAIRACRARPDFEALPLLVITAEPDDSAAADYLAAGATECHAQAACVKPLRAWSRRFLCKGQEDWLFDQWLRERKRNSAFDRVIVPLGLALFAEREYGRLLESILLEAKDFCMADGGTLYVRTAEDTLEFTMVHNDTLGISEGGSKAPVTRFPPIPLTREDTGEPDHRYIATHVALTGDAVNLPDAYGEHSFDVSGAKQFDASHGYRTQSVLAMPLKNQQDRVVGVLQLINARDPMTGAPRPFDTFQEESIASLARLAGSGLESFQRMNALREKIHALHLEIDEVKKQAQVAQIVGTEYFQGLKGKAQVLRDRVRNTAEKPRSFFGR